MTEELRTLPNGDQLSLKEVEVRYNEAWDELGKARRDPTTSPHHLRAAEGTVDLWGKTLHGGYEADADRVYADADARRVWSDDHRPSSRPPAIAREFNDMIDAKLQAYRADPTNARKKFEWESLERQRARDRGELDIAREW